MDQMLPQFQHHVDDIHFDFYDAMVSIEPTQCFICIRTPMLADGFKNIKYYFDSIFRYIALMFWEMKVMARLVQLLRMLVSAFSCKQYKLLNSH